MRFLVPGLQLNVDEVLIPTEICHHAFRVRRLRLGESFIINNGCGDSAMAVIHDWAHGPGTAQIIEQITIQTELPVTIIICQALPKSPERIEQVLQHGTELGAAGFMIFAGDRSVAKLETNDKVVKRLERWNSIVRSAAEQSGRALLPPVSWHPNLKAITHSITSHLLILHEEAETPLWTIATNPSSSGFALVVGPEGGLSPSEVSMCVKNGGSTISLGPRILRTETAALAAIAQLSYALESNHK